MSYVVEIPPGPIDPTTKKPLSPRRFLGPDEKTLVHGHKGAKIYADKSDADGAAGRTAQGAIARPLVDYLSRS